MRWKETIVSYGGHDREGCNDSEVTRSNRPPNQVKRAHGTDLFEEVYWTKISGNVRG
jgi:hypothetical protein